MYGRGGFTYVYFIYGMYSMLNFVTEPEGRAAAVLIRGIEPIEGLETMMRLRGCDETGNLTNGPGKICQAFSLDTSQSGIDITGSEMFVTESDPGRFSIATSSRIGIKDGTDRKWRFYIKGNRFVSI
jgi:DNA-3-methyladenine glycosylase